MPIMPSWRRLISGTVLCLALALGFGAGIAQASPLPAPMDDPAPPPPPGPDPSTLINEANTILPVIGQVTQYFLNPNGAMTGTTGPSAVQPPMLGPFAPGS
jgi:hypothetical protein